MDDRSSRTEAFTDLILEAARDPFRFEALVSAWNEQQRAEGGEPSQPGHGLDEFAVQDALLAIARGSDDKVVSAHIRRLLNALPNACLVANAQGLVLAMNEAALAKLALSPGDHIDASDLRLEAAEPLSEVVRAALDRSNRAEVSINRVYVSEDDAPRSIVVVPSGKQANALVFLIDQGWSAESEHVLRGAFDLTAAESAILVSFLKGSSLHDIAVERDRSPATIRTQFKTIMGKAGVRSQAELMRTSLSFAHFLDNIDHAAGVAAHPFRKSFELLRPGARTLEVHLAGAFDGLPVVFLPDATLFTFEASLEALFRREGLCLASMARPGFGATDVPLPGQSYHECLAADLAALLDQLKAPECVLLAHNMSTAHAFRLGALLPGRIRQIVVLSALAPRPYLEESDVSAPFAAALLRARDASEAMFHLMARIGMRAWKLLGVRRFNALQLAGYAPDLEWALRPESLPEFDRAMRASIEQGFHAAAGDFELATGDWSAWVRDCQVPVTLVHGSCDQVAGIASIRKFCQAFDHKLSLLEIPEAGFMAFTSHAEVLLGELVGAFTPAARPWREKGESAP